MDRKTILEKGLLLNYLLGELNAKDEELIESALQEDKVLRQEFQKLESDFERMALENAIAPPQRVKSSLEKTLTKYDNDTPVKSLSTSSAFNPARLLVAASLAAIFALTSFWFYNQWQTAEENIRVAREEKEQLQESLQKLSEEIQEVNAMYAQLNDKDVIPLLLKGNKLAPDARAVAFVNHKSKSVVVNPKALPALSEEETYQMWADVDGEMISMGLLPTDKDLVALTYIDKAESLNITIEPKGGNDHPTVERLISNIYL
ncbi:anti-sigma factor domain-containing protein [Muriicola sp. E247]|uniref:anti-sigma factor n=1 Tax=Muriicola sp. E247 TaxID=3242730 RepID=UPI0035234BA4